MRGRNVAVFVIILFLAGAGILYMMYETRRIDVTLGDRKTEQNTAELIDNLNSIDYEIYWIGTVPDYLDGISEHITLLTAAQADNTTLPVIEGVTGFNAYDGNGNVIQHIERREYADHMMIVINTAEELSDAAWDAVRDSAVDNQVPVLLIGKNNIDAFRAYMLLVHQNYDVNSTMYFEITRYPEDDPIDPETVAAGGHAYADALLAFIHDAMLDPAVVYVDMTAPTEYSETTEDGADAA